VNKVYIGIDDTDIVGSPGTGFHARKLAMLLEKKTGGTIAGITRHQLLVHPDIPYTSRNSSACLEIELKGEFPLIDICEKYLSEIAPPGSDVGLCITDAKKVNGSLAAWGHEAKTRVLNKQDALDLAKEFRVFLKGLTGTHDGIIGALAAVGLRHGGNDGRFVWLEGIKELRDLKEGVYPVEDLKQNLTISSVQTEDGEQARDNEMVMVSEWTRPLLIDHKPVLIVEKNNYKHDYEWKTLSKDYIRKIS